MVVVSGLFQWRKVCKLVEVRFMDPLVALIEHIIQLPILEPVGFIC